MTYRVDQYLHAGSLEFSDQGLSTLVLSGQRAHGAWHLSYLFRGAVVARVVTTIRTDVDQAWLIAQEAARELVGKFSWSVPAVENKNGERPEDERATLLAGVLVIGNADFSPVPDDLGPVAEVWRASEAPAGGDGYRRER